VRRFFVQRVADGYLCVPATGVVPDGALRASSVRAKSGFIGRPPRRSGCGELGNGKGDGWRRRISSVRAPMTMFRPGASSTVCPVVAEVNEPQGGGGRSSPDLHPSCPPTSTTSPPVACGRGGLDLSAGTTSPPIWMSDLLPATGPGYASAFSAWPRVRPVGAFIGTSRLWLWDGSHRHDQAQEVRVLPGRVVVRRGVRHYQSGLQGLVEFEEDIHC